MPDKDKEEYVKFDAPREELQQLAPETETPPPTPPELEPGTAGCRAFSEASHYVAPCYQEEAFQRIFSTKVIAGEMGVMVPLYISVFVTCFSERAHWEAFPVTNGILCAVSFLVGIAYIYLVGLFRNPPYIYIAIVVRTTILALLNVGISLIIHYIVLKIIHNQNVDSHGSGLTEEEAEEILEEQEQIEEKEHFFHHSPPYMIFLAVTLMYIHHVVMIVAFIKYKINVGSYMIPFLVYTITFPIAGILITLVLNDVFGHEPLGYDLFQVMGGCFFANYISMRTPKYLKKLFDGKVCPLREGEVLYAVIHFDM